MRGLVRMAGDGEGRRAKYSSTRRAAEGSVASYLHLIGEHRALIEHRAAALSDCLLKEEEGAHARVVDDGVCDRLRLLCPR